MASSPEGKPSTPSGTGLEPNVAGLLCYVLGWISGLIFLLLEPRTNEYVRFHAKQSIIVFGALTVVSIVLRALIWIPVMGIIFGIASYILGVLAFILWVVLMVKAYQGERYRLPWASELAEKWVV